MPYKRNPPTAGFQEFELRRPAYSETVTLHVLEESFRLNRTELGEWLTRVRCREAFKVIDLLWNFRRVLYNLAEQTYSVPDGPAPDDGSSRVDAHLRVMLGTRRQLDLSLWRSPLDAPGGRI